MSYGEKQQKEIASYQIIEHKRERNAVESGGD